MVVSQKNRRTEIERERGGGEIERRKERKGTRDKRESVCVRVCVRESLPWNGGGWW